MSGGPAGTTFPGSAGIGGQNPPSMGAAPMTPPPPMQQGYGPYPGGWNPAQNQSTPNQGGYGPYPGGWNPSPGGPLAGPGMQQNPGMGFRQPLAGPQPMVDPTSAGGFFGHPNHGGMPRPGFPYQR